MQFYLNGYNPGDPDIQAAAPGAEARPAALPDTTDVLIVGAGPAGMLLAAQLSAFPGITTRIVDRREGPLQVGQADGVACRTVETFDAFGLSGKLIREAYWVNETVFWRPSPEDRLKIVRTGRVQDTADGLSEFPHLIVNQARLLGYLEDYMHRSPSRLVPDYGWEFVTLTVEPAGDYPVIVTLENAKTQEEKKVRAKYVVGCDGARSRVRDAIGAMPRGDFANHAWGVVDMLADTNFPDIRLKAAIQSADEGNILLIPREGGYMVRLYVDLGEIDPANRDQALAKGYTIGMRFHSALVMRLADAKPVQLGHAARADGAWRIYAFADASGERLRALMDHLAQSERSPIRRFTPRGADIDSVIDVRGIFQQGHCDLKVEELPSMLVPRKGRFELVDYEKAYTPDLKNGPDIFDLRGIDRERGAMIVVRPDQHVANVLPLDAYDALADFFGQFMLDQH